VYRIIWAYNLHGDRCLFAYINIVLKHATIIALCTQMFLFIANLMSFYDKIQAVLLSTLYRKHDHNEDKV